MSTVSTKSGRIRPKDVTTNPPQRQFSRSPARARKTSPGTPARKSPPARQSGRKSPARKSPARKTLSPSRKTPSKYPARKSSARTKELKEVVEPVAPEPPKSPAKRPGVKSAVAVRLEKLDSFRSTRSRRIEYSVRDITSTQSEFAIESLNGIEPITELYGLKHRKSVEEITPRRSSRLREIIDNISDMRGPEPDIRRSVSKSHSLSKSVSKSISKSIDEDNSTDEFVREKSKSITRKLSTPLRDSFNNMHQIASRYEFGGRVGSAAFMILIPLTVVSILTSCMKGCTFNILINSSPFKSLGLWFSVASSIIVTTQVILQAIFAIVPIFGRWADHMDATERPYCFNAPFSAIMTVGILYGLDFSKTINKDAILNDYLRLATGSYIFAVVLSIGLFIKSQKAKNDLNLFGNTGYFLYDFFIGREIHPQLGKLNIKIWISRICNINTLILSMLIFSKGIKLNLKEYENLDLTNYQELQNKITLQPTILVFSMIQVIYILSYIIKEYRIASTFYWKSEGVGYLQTVSSALYPFYFTTISKYVADTNMMLSTLTLVIAFGLFAVGLIIMQASNYVKYEFRKNPLQYSLAKLESMPTYHGNKLIISGLWGALRHPNYAGDILIHVALSLPGVLSGEIVAASPAFITILMLLHRAWRDHARCKRRYGAAWHRYCTKVPSVIVPKVL